MVDEELDGCCNMSNEINPCRNDADYKECAKKMGISLSGTSCENENSWDVQCPSKNNEKCGGDVNYDDNGEIQKFANEANGCGDSSMQQ